MQVAQEGQELQDLLLAAGLDRLPGLEAFHRAVQGSLDTLRGLTEPVGQSPLDMIHEVRGEARREGDAARDREREAALLATAEASQARLRELQQALSDREADARAARGERDAAQADLARAKEGLAAAEARAVAALGEAEAAWRREKATLEAESQAAQDRGRAEVAAIRDQAWEQRERDPIHAIRPGPN